MSETLTNGVIVPDKGSRDWYADLRSNWIKLDNLMAGGNITVNPAQTEGVLVATITVGGKEYKLYQQDGDVSVKIDPSAENAEYPLVASTSAEANTGSVVMAPAVTVNPSTGAVTATSFKGKLDGNASTATNATKAVQDGAGAVITDTYATKSELGSKADDANVVHKSGDETIVGTKTFSGEVQTNTIRAIGGAPILRIENGSGLYLYKKDHDTLPGGIILRSLKADNTFIDFVTRTNGIITWNNANILTDANQIMLAKNLSGTDVAVGGIIDCGTGNGKLQGWFITHSGELGLSGIPAVGKWKNVNVYHVANNASGMFVKVG